MMLFVLGLVTIIMGASIYLFATTRYIPTYTGLIHNTNLAFVWTLMRCVILLLIALPSFSLIYALDDLINTEILTLMLPGGWVVRPLGWTRGGLYQTTKHPLYFSPGKPFGNQHTSLAGDASGLLANAPEYYCATALRKYRIEFIIFYRLSTTPCEEEMLLSEYASLNSIQNNCGCRGWCSGLPFKIKT